MKPGAPTGRVCCSIVRPSGSVSCDFRQIVVPPTSHLGIGDYLDVETLQLRHRTHGIMVEVASAMRGSRFAGHGGGRVRAPSTIPMTHNLFSSFFMGGFECSTHRL